MSKLKYTGTFSVGLLNAKDEQQRSFTMGLLTVNNEIAMHESLLMNHPNMDGYSDFKAFTIERAARYSLMLESVGDIVEITPEMLLELTSDDFEILTNAEIELSKKLKEPLVELSPEAQ